MEGGEKRGGEGKEREGKERVEGTLLWMLDCARSIVGAMWGKFAGQMPTFYH